jgi:hypothetical protein
LVSDAGAGSGRAVDGIRFPEASQNGNAFQLIFLTPTLKCVLCLRGEVHAPYNALLPVGPVAILVEIWWNQRR